MSNGERRGFTITKFGKHPEGYFHARLTVDGRTVYVTRRWGSWMADGEVNGRAVRKEVLSPYKEALAEKAAQWEGAEAKAIRAAAKAANGAITKPLEVANVGGDAGEPERSDQAVSGD